MPESDRNPDNVVVFPVEAPVDTSGRPDPDSHAGLRRYFKGARVQLVAQSPVIVRHFGAGWRGVISTGLTGVALGLLVALIVIVC